MTTTQFAPAPAVPRNGLGVSSFVLGIVAVALSWIPVFNLFLTLPCAFTGLGTGLGGVHRVNHGSADNKAMTWIGVGLSIAGVVITVAMYVIAAIVGH